MAGKGRNEFSCNADKLLFNYTTQAETYTNIMISARETHWWWFIVRVLIHTWEACPSIHARPLALLEQEVAERFLPVIVGEQSEGEGETDSV